MNLYFLFKSGIKPAITREDVWPNRPSPDYPLPSNCLFYYWLILVFRRFPTIHMHRCRKTRFRYPETSRLISASFLWIVFDVTTANDKIQFILETVYLWWKLSTNRWCIYLNWLKVKLGVALKYPLDNKNATIALVSDNPVKIVISQAGYRTEMMSHGTKRTGWIAFPNTKNSVNLMGKNE